VLLTNPSGTDTQLFDLSHDLSQKKNLANAQPELAKDLKNRLIHWKNNLPANPAK
jgi:hypothetical protein